MENKNFNKEECKCNCSCCNCNCCKCCACCSLSNPTGQAYHILHLAFTIAPIVAGLDKFFNFLTQWQQYLSSTFNVFGDAHMTMLVVGVIEVVAGIGVWVKPKIFSYVVALWLLGIIVNLLLLGEFYDIALRDLGLLLGALALARLSQGLCEKHSCLSQS